MIDAHLTIYSFIDKDKDYLLSAKEVIDNLPFKENITQIIIMPKADKIIIDTSKKVK